MTIIITLIADWSATAIDTVGKVTPDVYRIKQKVILAQVVGPLSALTVPVLATVICVRIPAIRHGGAVHLVVAGHRCCLTVLVAGSADWTVSALDRFWVVTPIVDRIVQQVILADHVFTSTSVTVPVFAAIVWIHVVSINFVCTVLHVTAVWGWWRFCDTVSVAFIANWTFIALDIFWIITPLFVWSE